MPSPSRYAADPLARLKRRETTAANDAVAEIERARRAIRRDVLALTRELDVGGSADAREDALSAVRKRIARLRRRLERIERAALEYAAKEAVRDGSEKTGVEVRYSKERADEMIGVLAGDAGKSLAAVFTEKMEENVMDALRRATVSALRENAVAGGSERDLARTLEDKWLAAAGRGETYQFVDSGGRVWDTKTYVAMNVRTNAMRVYNDCMADTLARATGGDFVRVSTGGAPDCRLCFPWEGRILSLTGKTEGFPTYEEARKAGCFHPNCVHTLEYVDELLDADEVELQRAHPMPTDEDGEISPDAADENRYEIDQDRYRRQGMDAEQARVAVDRDNLEASIRAGLIREDARAIVDGMTDAQVMALCKDGNPPAFEPTKKATRADPHAADEKWAHGSRGGTIHVARDADAAKILEVCKTTDADLTLAKARAIEKAGASDGETLRLSPISRETAEEVKRVCGVAPTSLIPTVGGDEIRHTFNRHGKHVDGMTKGEKNKKQIPITADDISKIGTVINEYDTLSVGSFNDTENAPSVKFQKRMEDGTIYAVFVVADSLTYKTMWKKK